MIDFLLTPEGDLSFVEDQLENNRLKIDFYKTKSNALRILFDIAAGAELEPSSTALTINFNVLTNTPNKKALIAKDERYLIQQLLMRLKTSLGELPERQEIGSTLETVKHKRLNDKTTKAAVEAIVSSAIQDLYDGYLVKATPVIDKTDGYKQIMNVEIYKDNNLLLNYEMEG